MEEAIKFSCSHKKLYGVLHTPDNDTVPSTVLLIVSGGPQVRTGPHRLYVQLSRFLCDHNVTSLRFDYEGLGDSEGSYVGYQYAESSIAAAASFLQDHFNSRIDIIIWSLCDGATAAALYAARNPQSIKGLILCNPYILTDASLARTTLDFYYKRRFFDKQFWHKLFTFKVNYLATMKSLWENFSRGKFFSNKNTKNYQSDMKSLPDLVLDSFVQFNKPIKLILSADDVVAANFLNEIERFNSRNKDVAHELVHQSISGADHTFSDPIAKKELFSMTYNLVTEMNACA